MASTDGSRQPARGGAAYLVCGVLAIASVTIALKESFAAGADPRELASAQVLIAGLLATPFLPGALRGGLARRALLAAAGGGVALALVLAACWEALDRLPAGVAIVLIFCAPAWVAIGQPLFLRQPLRRGEALGGVLAIAGIVVMVGSFDSSLDLAAIGIALTASVTFAAYLVLTQRLEPVSSVAGSAALVLPFAGVAAFALWPGAGVKGLAYLPGDPYAILSALLIFAWAVLLAIGVRRTSAMTAVVVSALEPAIVSVASYFIFSESLSAREIVGGVIVLVGSLLAMLQDARRTEAAPAPALQGHAHGP
jgi:drug/metabolite transporter (DMT)-like permease